MADAAQRTMQGFLTGRSLKLDENERSRAREREEMQMEQQRSEQQRQQRLGGLLSQYAQGNQEVLGDIAALGPKGISAAQGIGKLQEAEFSQAKDRYKLLFKNAMTLPEDQQEQAYQVLIADAVKRNLLPRDDANQISMFARQNPQSFADNMASYLGIEKETALASGVKNVIMPDGEQRSYDITDPEQRQAYQATITEGGRDIPSRQEVGQPGEFNLEKGEAKKARETVIGLENSTRKFLGDVQATKEILEQSPDANTLAARLAGIGDDLITEVKSASTIVGGEAAQDATRILEQNLGDYDTSLLESYNIQNSRMRSAIIGLAYQKALQANQRVTDADFKAALAEIGASASNPVAFRSVLDDIEAKALRQYGSTYDTYKRNYPSEIGEKADFGVQEIPTINNKAGYAALPSGAEFIGPDGDRYIKP